MNDIAAVILHVMKDENDAYDVFSSIMETHVSPISLTVSCD